MDENTQIDSRSLKRSADSFSLQKLNPFMKPRPAGVVGSLAVKIPSMAFSSDHKASALHRPPIKLSLAMNSNTRNF